MALWGLSNVVDVFDLFPLIVFGCILGFGVTVFDLLDARGASRVNRGLRYASSAVWFLDVGLIVTNSWWIFLMYHFFVFVPAAFVLFVVRAFQRVARGTTSRGMDATMLLVKVLAFSMLTRVCAILSASV